MKGSFFKAGCVLAVLAATALGACKAKSQNAAAVSGDAPALASVYPEFGSHRSIEITWFEQGWTGPMEGMDIIAPEIEKRTNLKLIYEAMTVPTDNDYRQKLNLMIAAREVPDVFFGGIDTYTRDVYERLGQGGMLWDLAPLIKDYENLYELVYPELNLYQTSDGKNFFVPTQTGRGYENLNEPPHGLHIRQDFLDKLGMKCPETPDELYTYLKRATSELKVNGQQVHGLLFGENLGGITGLLDMYFPLIGQHEASDLPIDVEDNFRVKNYGYTNSPELMAAAKFVNKLSREGLIDREALTIKTPQFQEKGSSGLYAAVFASWWDINIFTDNAKSTISDIAWLYPPEIFSSQAVKASRYRPWTDWVGCYSTIIFSKKIDEATVRHLLAVMDYFAGSEGQLLVQAGIEGVTYDWAEDGTYFFTDKFKEDTNDLDWNKAAAYGVFYYAQLVNNTPEVGPLQGTPPALLREDNYRNWLSQKEWRDHYDKFMDPPLDYYFLRGEVEAEKFSPIRDLRLEFFANLISARSDSEVETLVNRWGASCESLGIRDIVAERQRTMDAIVARRR
jgi:ABC-type glycerol-3-phosphate transport system substrate-binding protein